MRASTATGWPTRAVFRQQHATCRRDLSSRLAELSKRLDGLQCTFEDMQDFLGLPGLRIWHQQTAAVAAASLAKEETQMQSAAGKATSAQAPAELKPHAPVTLLGRQVPDLPSVPMRWLGGGWECVLVSASPQPCVCVQGCRRAAAAQQPEAHSVPSADGRLGGRQRNPSSRAPSSEAGGGCTGWRQPVGPQQDPGPPCAVLPGRRVCQPHQAGRRWAARRCPWRSFVCRMPAISQPATGAGTRGGLQVLENATLCSTMLQSSSTPDQALTAYSEAVKKCSGEGLPLAHACQHVNSASTALRIHTDGSRRVCGAPVGRARVRGTGSAAEAAAGFGDREQLHVGSHVQYQKIRLWQERPGPDIASCDRTVSAQHAWLMAGWTAGASSASPSEHWRTALCRTCACKPPAQHGS